MGCCCCRFWHRPFTNTFSRIYWVCGFGIWTDGTRASLACTTVALNGSGGGGGGAGDVVVVSVGGAAVVFMHQKTIITINYCFIDRWAYAETEPGARDRCILANDNKISQLHFRRMIAAFSQSQCCAQKCECRTPVSLRQTDEWTLHWPTYLFLVWRHSLRLLVCLWVCRHLAEYGEWVCQMNLPPIANRYGALANCQQWKWIWIADTRQSTSLTVCTSSQWRCMQLTNVVVKLNRKRFTSWTPVTSTFTHAEIHGKFNHKQ